jgi:hypothetical protein
LLAVDELLQGMEDLAVDELRLTTGDGGRSLSAGMQRMDKIEPVRQDAEYGGMGGCRSLSLSGGRRRRRKLSQTLARVVKLL